MKWSIRQAQDHSPSIDLGFWDKSKNECNRTMKHYFKVYKTLLKLNLSELFAYRAGFVNSIISSSLWGGFQIVWVTLLTARIDSFYGWTKDELILITVNYVFIIMGIFHLVFSRNFDRFSRIIDKAELDLILVKPLDSQFLLSFWYFNYASLFRLIIGVPIVIYLIIKIGISISLINVISYLVLIVFSIILMYSVWLSFSTLMIWFPRLSNITALLYNINGISRFPPDMIYELKSFILFFLVPFTLLSAIPTKALVKNIFSGDTGLLIFLSVFLFYISKKFWKFALRYYTSASS